MDIALIRRLLPYVADFGSPAFRRWVLDMFPHKGAQKVKSIVDVMHQRSVEIYRSKKEALKQGDEAVTQQIGEGKDLMSILCAQCAPFNATELLLTFVSPRPQ